MNDFDCRFDLQLVNMFEIKADNAFDIVDCRHGNMNAVQLEPRRNNPTLDLVERIANALNIKTYELFLDPLSPNVELERLRHEIKDDVRQLLDEALEKVIACYSKK